MGIRAGFTQPIRSTDEKKSLQFYSLFKLPFFLFCQSIGTKIVYFYQDDAQKIYMKLDDGIRSRPNGRKKR